MNYFFRLNALGWVLGWLAWSTSQIGKVTKEVILDWEGAWMLAAVIALSVLFGWLAAKEGVKP